MKNLRILVLEDDPFQRLVAIVGLRQLGLTHILEAQDGAEALRLLERRGVVDVAFCDLRMAGMDGLGFLRQASQAGLLGAVILCSAVEPPLRQATVEMISCLGLECLGDLGKPFDIERAAHLLDGYRPAPPAAKAPPPSEAPTARDIRRGLREGEFEAYFQPKVRLATGEPVAAEVLARWRHPRLGVLSPASFLPQMQEEGLIGPLFWQLLRQGLALQRELADAGRPLRLAFNVEATQLARRGFARGVQKALENARLPGEGVIVELTETGLLQAPAACLESLVRLRLLGCGLAMDDFGAGHSSLERLSELPFSQLKLDASFVRRLGDSPRNAAIIGTTVALSQALGLALVVEGVESEEQRDRLLALGCEIAQGYLFARPLDGQSFRTLLASGATLPLQRPNDAR